MALSDEQEERIAGLHTTHGKIAHVEWDGHVLVFKKPGREAVASFRRAADSPAEKPGATDQLCQSMLIAYDEETDKRIATQRFTREFLEEYPMFTSSDKLQSVLGPLLGLVEEEATASLGKGVSVRNAKGRTSPKG